MPAARYSLFLDSSASSARLIAAPIGVSPPAISVGGKKLCAVWNDVSIVTGPNEMTIVSTRLAASESDNSSLLNSASPALSASIGAPAIEPDRSNSRTHGHLGSGLSAKLSVPNAVWVAN